MDASDWTAWEGTVWPNIYKCTIPFTPDHDVGSILFDHGRAWGIRVRVKNDQNRVENGHVFNGIEHFDSFEGKFTPYDGLKNNLEFYYDSKTGTIYLYCDYGLPDEVFESIELCDKGHGIRGESENVVIDNLAVYGSGSFAIGYHEGNSWETEDPSVAHIGGIGYNGYYDMPVNVTVQNCAFYYCGGSDFIQYPEPYNQDYAVPYADVVRALDASAQNFTVQNCYSIQLSTACQDAFSAEPSDAPILYGTTTAFRAAGITAEVAAVSLRDNNSTLHSPGYGYEKDHKKVIVTAEQQENVIHLYADDERQEIVGFGACTTPGYAESLMGCEPEIVEKVVTKLYDAEEGAGLSLHRVQIGAGNGYNDCCSISETEWNDAAEEPNLWMLDQVTKQTKEITIITCPWSPPAWMKTTNAFDNGTEGIEPRLEKEHYDDFAQYFVDIYRLYESRGYTIKYMAIQNEPGVGSGNACCLYTHEEMMEVAKVVTNRFKEEGIDIVVCINDEADPATAWGAMHYYEANDQDFLENGIGALTLHGYKYNAGMLSATDLGRYGLPMFQTERSSTVLEYRPITNQMMMRFGNELGDYLQHGFSGWCHWTGAMRVDSLGTPAYDALDDNSVAKDGMKLFAFSNETGEFLYGREYFAVGQYAKFMRPGFVRVGSDSGNPNLRVTCAKDPETGKLITVVVNNGLEDYTVTIDGLTATAARLVRSGEGENWAEVGNVDIIDGVATVTFKAQTITTVVEE